MNANRTAFLAYWLSGINLLWPAAAAAITVGQVDTFQDSVANWSSGLNAGTVIETGGPDGVGDAYLQVVADGGPSSGSKLSIFNSGAFVDSQWAGDYIAAGITSISAMMRNEGDTPLDLRLVFGDTRAPDLGGVWYASSQSISLPALGDWTAVDFPILEPDLASVENPGAYADLMSDVVTLRFIHAAAPSARGDTVVATLGIDNIMANAAAEELVGDYNLNGMVDAPDYNVWRDNFGSDENLEADGNDDGMINAPDYNVWRDHFGDRADNLAVPEPASLLLAMSAFLFGLCRPRAVVPSKSA